MKKWVLLLSAVLLAGCITACGTEGGLLGNTGSEKITSLSDKGLDMTKLMSAVSQDEGYTSIYSNSPDFKEEFSKIGATNMSSPKGSYEIHGFSDAYWSLLTAEQNISLSEAAKKVVDDKLAMAPVSQINGVSGTTALAVTTVLNLQDAFLYEGLETPVTYVYVYDGDYGSMVTFLPKQDKIVTAYAGFFANDGLKEVNSAEELGNLFKKAIGITGLEITAVK